MTKIHHATAKKAKAHGIELTVEDNEVVAVKNAVRLASHLSGTVALQMAIDKLTDMGELNATMQPKRSAKSQAKAARGQTPKKSKKISVYETAARDAGWTGRGGNFSNADEDNTSDAKDWRALCAEQEIEVEGDEDGKSIIKRKYRKLYRPHHNTNGDELAQLMREHLVYEDDAGEEKIDVALLKRFAQANECWMPEYAKLNPGQQRMNVGNRLRAKVRKDEYKIKWVK